MMRGVADVWRFLKVFVRRSSYSPEEDKTYVVSPFLSIGNTDKVVLGLDKNIYRYVPGLTDFDANCALSNERLEFDAHLLGDCLLLLLPSSCGWCQ